MKKIWIVLVSSMVLGCGGMPGMEGQPGLKGDPGPAGMDGKPGSIPIGNTLPTCSEMNAGQLFVNTGAAMPTLQICNGNKWNPLNPPPQRPVYTNPATMKQYSLDASFCGVTSPTKGNFEEGSFRGYPAAKAKCESTCKSPTAHMCTAEEMLRHVSTGGKLPTGSTDAWVATGVYSRTSGTLDHYNDCGGFTNATDAGFFGNVWGDPDGAQPFTSPCNGPGSPIACCD